MSLCAGQHVSDHDPTLASCCQRDLAQQAQNRKHLYRLQAADCSTARSNMSAAVLATPNSSDQPLSEEFSDISSEDEAGDTYGLVCCRRRSPLEMLTDVIC